MYVPAPGKAWKDRHDMQNCYYSFPFSSPFKALTQNIIKDGIYLFLWMKKKNCACDLGDLPEEELEPFQYLTV